VAENDAIQRRVPAEHAAMKIFVYILCALVACESLLAAEPSACSCSAYAEASFSPSTKAAISEFKAALEKKAALSWDREIPHNFLNITAGTATVLAFETDETVCGTSGGYRIADCGSRTMAVMSLNGHADVGKRFSFENDQSNVTAIYRGVADGPGRSGCFGVSAKGTALIIDATSDSLTASVDVEYKLFGLFDFPQSCGTYQLHGVYRFMVKQPIDWAKLN
jgi:hypothetical protein